MKAPAALATLLLGSVATSDLLAQGQFRWGNFFTGVLRAPIYGVDPANPMEIRRGNTSMGIPAGTQTYAGALLQGTGFTAAIYLGQSPSEVMANNTPPVANGINYFRTGLGAGFTLANLLSEDSSPIGTTVYYQFRAWDNVMGTVTSWSQVMASGGTVAAGTDNVNILPPIGGIMPRDTVGIRSFQLTQVPEPSLIGLGALGLGGLLLRRRK